MDSFKSTVAPKTRFNHMWDIAARNNEKPLIVKVKSMSGKVRHYVGDVK